MSLYVAALFVALTPGVLLTLPKGGSKLTVAVTHGLVFGLVYYLTHMMVKKVIEGAEGFQVYQVNNMLKLLLLKPEILPTTRAACTNIPPMTEAEKVKAGLIYA
jgi:hypothetical protein